MTFSLESNSRSWGRTKAKVKQVQAGQIPRLTIAASLECFFKPALCTPDWNRAESAEGQVALIQGSESPYQSHLSRQPAVSSLLMFQSCNPGAFEEASVFFLHVEEYKMGQA